MEKCGGPGLNPVPEDADQGRRDVNTIPIEEEKVSARENATKSNSVCIPQMATTYQYMIL